MQAEHFMVEAVDSLIRATTLRMEQQRITIDDAGSSPRQVATATAALGGMRKRLEGLKRYRAKFT